MDTDCNAGLLYRGKAAPSAPRACIQFGVFQPSVHRCPPKGNRMAHCPSSSLPKVLAPTSALIGDHRSYQVQCGIGASDYVRRDYALKNLIQPLAGEYGMHNGEDQGN
eukprot:scaffold39462_cov31-Prasinocladus_malaysianus.AAC.1